MRKKIVVLIIAVMMIISCVLFTACQKEVVSTSIKMPIDKLTHSLDDSIDIYNADAQDYTRANVNRGFRYETYYTLGSGNAWPNDGLDGYEYLDDMLNFYSEIEIKEIQVYIYLTDYKAKDLDTHALNQLKAYFEHIKQLGMTMVFRFAYEPDQDGNNAPTQKQMLSNISILKNWIDQNLELWYSTVTAHQIGHIGAWGEFGSSKQKYDRKKIVNAICDMTPANTYIQGRYTDVTTLADKKYQDRMGYHNDFLIGRPHPWNTAGGDNDAKKYKLFEQTNKLRINDGEMPWAGATQEPNEFVDGKNLAKQLYEHHMTSLSLEHNYREFIKGANKPAEYYNIMRYTKETLTLEDVKQMGVPYYTQYFIDKNGKAINRSTFDYIRDFLGYRLVLSNLIVTKSGANTKISLMITNFGFGAPLNLQKAEIVYASGGQLKTIQANNFNVKALTTFGQNIISVEIPNFEQAPSIGIKFTTYGGHNIATVNQNKYIGGVNYIQLP